MRISTFVSWLSLAIGLWTRPACLLAQIREGFQDSLLCPGDGWGMAFVNDGLVNELLGSSTWCFRLNPPAAFHEALQTCHRQQGMLLTLSSKGRKFSVDSSGKNIYELLALHGVNSTWQGFYVLDDRLREDNFPPTQSRYHSPDDPPFKNIEWDDSSGQQEPSGLSPCFEAHINITRQQCSENYYEDEVVLLPELQNTTTTSTTAIPSNRSRRWANAFIGVEDESPDFYDPDSEGKGRWKRSSAFEGDCIPRPMVVRSRACEAQLHSVCVRPAISSRNITLQLQPLVCGAREVGHVRSTRCFSFGDGSLQYSEARDRCTGGGGEGRRPGSLYQPNSDLLGGVGYFNSLLVTQLNQYMYMQDKFWSPLSMAWVERSGGDDHSCRALLLATRTIIAWDCEARLPLYICQHPVAFHSNIARLRVEVSSGFESELISVSNINGSDDREALVPAFFPGSNYSPFVSCVFDSALVPELQSVRLMKGGIPMAETHPPSPTPIGDLSFPTVGVRRRRQAQKPFEILRASLTNDLTNEGLSMIYWNNVTDYYWCEINDLTTGTIYKSGRVFVRLIGTDVYAASVVSNLPDTDFWYLHSLTEILGRDLISKNFLFNPETNIQPRVIRFRPTATGNGSIVNLHFFKSSERPSVRRRRQSDGLPTVRQSLNSTLMQITQDILDYLNTSRFGNIYKVNHSTLVVRSIEMCPSLRLKDPLSGHIYAIPDTRLGVTFTSPHVCMSNGEPYVKLQCAGDKVYGAQWSEFEPNQGCNFTHLAQSSATNTLQSIAVSDIKQTTQAQTVSDTVQVISGTVTFAPVDVVYIADILQQLASVGGVTPELAKSVLELVDKVVELNDTTLQTANTVGNATNRIVKTVEDLGRRLMLNDSLKIRLVTDSAALEVWNLTAVTGDVIIGLELRVGGEGPVDVLKTEDLESVFESRVPPYTNTDAAILLPAQFVRSVKRNNPGKDIRLIMNVFADISLLKMGRLDQSPSNESINGSQAALNSKVISASITVDGVPLTDLAGNDVKVIFLPIIALPLEARPLNTTCVFWDFAGSKGQGAWSTEGCRYDNTVEGRDVCVCDHLTNFAVLLDVYGQDKLPEEHQSALSIITIVGLSLSIAGLSITVLSFILIKKLRQGRPQQTLFNMALAMLCSWVVFLAGFSRVDAGVGCLAVAALLHYFILASFLWMLMEGILQYLLFVKILGNAFDNYMVKTAVPAWGLPLIPVIVVLAIDPELYSGGDRYCWMALTPFYYAFLAPVALVMLVNMVVYVMVVVNICRRGSISSSSSSKRAVGIRASVACFVVLGLSWVLAFLAVEDARVVFQYLFTITASLQGFLIFLIFTARDPTVRAYWWRCLCCRQPAEKHSGPRGPHGPLASKDSHEGPLTRSQQSSGSSTAETQMLSRRTSPDSFVISTSVKGRHSNGGRAEKGRNYL